MNLLPKSPLNYILSGDTIVSFLKRLLRSKDALRNLGVYVSVMSRFPRFSTAEIWNMDHFLCVLGMWNENYLRADVNAHMELIREYKPDAVVDFWNEGACIAARAWHKPLITVIQADQHPENRGFITYSERESNARRIAAVGAGDFVLPKANASGRRKRVNAAEVRDKADRLLTDVSFKENAKRIREKFSTYGGAPYAASLIEDLA